MKGSKVKKGKLHQIFSRIFSAIMSVALIFGVVVSDYNQVKATGIEELMYYTYWDLVNSLFAATGFEMSIDDKVLQDKANRVSGEQMWEAFKYDVSRQFDGVEYLADELEKLALTATLEGIKMSPELFKALGAAFDSLYGSSSSGLTYEQASNFDLAPIINSYTPLHLDSYVMNTTSLCPAICTLSEDGKIVYYCIVWQSRSLLPHASYCYRSSYYLAIAGYNSSGDTKRFYVDGSGFAYNSADSSWYLARNFNSNSLNSCDIYDWEVNTLWADGVEISDLQTSDIISATSVAACPAEVPETIPWEVNPSIPDGWRIVDPNEDPEKQPDVLPGVIPFPIIPPGQDPDSTEVPDSTEDPDSTQSPEVNPHPGIQINPVTGNEIDPATGLDIDPETGFLIYPGTGQLINPETGEVIDPETGEVTSIDPVISGGYGDITKLFPFCIPFDLINLVKGMKADKSPPVFHFEFYFKTIDYNFVVDVDLTDYEKYIQIFRFGMQIFWIIALMFLTVKVSNLFV